MISVALLVHAKDKKPPKVSAVFGQARYVYVEAVDGKEFDRDLNPDDRMAIADVRDALSEWKRYTIVASRDEADLVIVVRKGSAAAGNVGVTPRRGQMPTGTGLPGVPSAGAQIGGDVGPADDLFQVCQVNPNGKLSGPLWDRMMPDGLRAPRVMLLREFEQAVDDAFPLQPPAAKAQTQQGSQPQPAAQPPGQQP
jgi:hypothetical protein